MPSYQPFDPKRNDISRHTARNSTSDAWRPPCRFAPNKVLLELRSRCLCAHETGPPCSRFCKNNQRRVSAAPQYSSNIVGSSMNTNSNSLHGSGSGTVFNVASDAATNGFSAEKEIAGNCPSKKFKNPPPKVILQLWDRGSRRNAVQRTSVDSIQHEQDRPAYARRFMLSRPESNTSALNTPLNDERSPSFVMDSDLKELPQFVLPPLPLGLRPPSPEPRNSLLDAPKKTRFPPSRCSSDAFDLSSLTWMLEPYETTNFDMPKRCVRRQLRFGD